MGPFGPASHAIRTTGNIKATTLARVLLNLTLRSPMDSYVEHLEQRLVERVQRGGLTASAKDRVDRTLDAIQHKVRRDKHSSPRQ